MPQKEHERVSETGVFPSLDRVSETLSLSHYVTDIGVDLAGLLGGRMPSAEGGSVSSGVAYGEGCPLYSRLRGLGERCELPQRGPGRSPGRKRDFDVF